MKLERGLLIAAGGMVSNISKAFWRGVAFNKLVSGLGKTSARRQGKVGKRREERRKGWMIPRFSLCAHIPLLFFGQSTLRYLSFLFTAGVLRDAFAGWLYVLVVLAGRPQGKLGPALPGMPVIESEMSQFLFIFVFGVFRGVYLSLCLGVWVSASWYLGWCPTSVYILVILRRVILSYRVSTLSKGIIPLARVILRQTDLLKVSWSRYLGRAVINLQGDRHRRIFVCMIEMAGFVRWDGI